MFQLGRAVTIEVGGKKYHLSRLERRIVEQFRDWIAEREGDPFAYVKELLSALAPGEAKAMIAEAKAVKGQLQAFSIGCPLSQKYMQTELGQGELLYLLLQEKHPDITRDEAFSVWAELGAREFAKSLQQTQGQPPTEKNGDPPAEARRPDGNRGISTQSVAS